MGEIANITMGWMPQQAIQSGRRIDVAANPGNSVRRETSENIQKNQETPQVQSIEKNAQANSRWINSGDVFAIQIHFKLDDKTQDIRVEIVDSRTGDILMKIPSRDLIDILCLSSESRGNIINVSA